jgi:CRP-like cAMP-binding protein
VSFLNDKNMVDCSNCIEGKDSIFNVLTIRQKETLKKNHICINYKKGEIIFKEGFKPQGLICLSDGKVKIYKEGVGGRDQIIRLTKSGNFIGFRALFADDLYIASAQAIEDSNICIIDKNILFKLIAENSELALAFIKLLATELGNSNVRTVSLTQKHIRGRLAESIIVLGDIYGLEDDNKTLKISMGREDIANLSNMTTSNAIRTLSSFASEKVIELVGKKIKILDFEQLEKISNLG